MSRKAEGGEATGRLELGVDPGKRSTAGVDDSQGRAALVFLGARATRLPFALREIASDLFIARILDDSCRVELTAEVFQRAWSLSCLDAHRRMKSYWRYRPLEDAPWILRCSEPSDVALGARQAVAVFLKSFRRVAPAECRILHLLSQGLNSRTVGDKLHLNECTVRSRAAKGRSIAQRLGLERHLKA